jgi:AraC family transcriptional activator of pobA
VYFCFLVKMAKSSIPVYDLNTINRKKLHEEIVAESIKDITKFYEKRQSPHRYAFYQIVLFTQGSGTKTIDFEKFNIEPGQIYFMIPGQVHSWEISGKAEGYVISFSEKVFRSFISNPFYLEQFSFLRGIPNCSVIHLEKSTLKEAIYFIKQIMNEVKKKDTFSLDQVCLYLMSLFISISRHYALSDKKLLPAQNQNTLSNFRVLVNQHYIEKRLPKEYAAMLYVTPNYLNALCRDFLGKSAGQLIRERVLLEAKRLLVNTDINISEIAYRLNFKDNSYFTKFFKKYAGVTPEYFKTSFSL